jgi:hypothetical protein
MRRGARAVAACLVLGGMTACAASVADPVAVPPGRAVAVLRQETYAQCPLQVRHPSVHWVTTRPDWARMLAGSRTMPPSHDPNETDFTRHTIVLVAMPTTPTSSTVALDGAEPVRLQAAEQRLEIAVRAVARDVPSADMRATVIGAPCAIVWVQSVNDVRQVIARAANGQVVARLDR